jgi:hypothetical protein
LGLGLPIMDSIMAIKKLANNPKMKANILEHDKDT